MTTQHTPGPWRTETVDDTCYILPPLGNDDACVTSIWVKGNGQNPCKNLANARLIAAAPELLELCQTVLLRLDVEHAERIAKGETAPHFICAALRDDLRAAIAKATGGAQ